MYAAADVFVFPSKTDTFGLVLLEAMACGLPVAAYPVTGPLDVIGDSKAGVLHEDLRTACLEALELRREDALARARLFTWRAATEQFFGHLHPRKRAVLHARVRVIPQAQTIGCTDCTEPVPRAPRQRATVRASYRLAGRNGPRPILGAEKGTDTRHCPLRIRRKNNGPREQHPMGSHA